MLPRLHKHVAERGESQMERKKSKRQRIVQFFRWRKQKPESHNESSRQLSVDETSPKTPPNEPEPEPESEPEPAKVAISEQLSNSADKIEALPTGQIEDKNSPASTVDAREEEKTTILSEAQIRTLFVGAPHFSAGEVGGRLSPTVVYPWDTDITAEDVSDSIHLDEPAFFAATLHQHSSKLQSFPVKKKQFHGYPVDMVELPSMLSAQGIELGSIGFAHFLELPKSDSLATGLEQSQSSKDFLEATRNKELMQTSPERIGIRPVQVDLIYDRLVEFQDLYEAFHDSPGPMTILNNQSSGDLYANLFSKLLTPPGFDGTDDDPTGLPIQITALLRALNLGGVWYDFSLVECRIKLGQILWTDPEPASQYELHIQWSEREILLLQITLACELLLRLDALTIKKTHHTMDQAHIAPDDIRGFSKMKSRKIDWDLILARRFLENILVVNSGSIESSSAPPESRGLTSLLGANTKPESPQTSLVLLPRHQSCYLSGLAFFAKSLHWPSTAVFMEDLAQKLGISSDSEQVELGSSSSGRFFEPTTPSAIHAYRTPLQTPRSTNHLQESYFGHISKPSLSRNDSLPLKISLSSPSSSSTDHADPPSNSVGGWLSRSYLTGLILPGEPISHFLISTLLENDRSAVATLGDSANLYGGFTWRERTWWSKTSIVGRVLACIEGSTECMGWISCTKLPDDIGDRWHSIQSERLPYEDRICVKDGPDLVSLDSAMIPEENLGSAKYEDFVFPSDSELLSMPPPLKFRQWELTPLNLDLMDIDTLPSPLAQNEILVASLTFGPYEQGAQHTLTLAYDIQFITSWPCIRPASALTPSKGISHFRRSFLMDTSSRFTPRRMETLSRRNSHGFEPLLSHPPGVADIAPQRRYSIDAGDLLNMMLSKSKPMNSHPLHKSYSYRTVLVTEVLDPKFVLPTLSLSRELASDTSIHDNTTVLVLDARASPDFELLARAWCAEKGFHALIGRVERTCISCCIREARGLGVRIVIRV